MKKFKDHWSKPIPLNWFLVKLHNFHKIKHYMYQINEKVPTFNNILKIDLKELFNQPVLTRIIP